MQPLQLIWMQLSHTLFALSRGFVATTKVATHLAVALQIFKDPAQQLLSNLGRFNC